MYGVVKKMTKELTKGEIHARLLHVRDLRRKQKAEIIAGYVKPIDDNLKLLDKVLHGQANIKQYIYATEQLNKYLKELIGGKDGKQSRRKNV